MIKYKDIQQIMGRINVSAWGISSPTLAKKYQQTLDKWLGNNYHGTMKWMERKKEIRKNIQKKYPWAETALVILDNYYNVPVVARNGLRISRHVQGVDYHSVLRKKLSGIFALLQLLDPDIKGKIFVDSGDIQEKALAEQAGLGWIGKNGLFIGQGIGSFCFIAVLILSVKIDPFKSIGDQCRDCRMCIDACPTRAIVEPGLINCNRCISYLSIEKKGELDCSEEKLLSEWVYGCDVCQEICPWNEKWAKVSRDRRYHQRKALVQEYIELGKCVELGKFNDVFDGTAIKRIGFEQLQRNVLAALKQVENGEIS